MRCCNIALWLCTCCVLLCVIGKPTCNNNLPVIGILSQPGEPAPKGHSYIAASYVKFVEQGGARVVPIPFDITPEALHTLVQHLNGVLIPGGSQNLSPGHAYYDTSARLLQHAVDAANAGEHWPLWGTCLGFEALAIAIAHNTSLLGHFDSLNLPSAVSLVDSLVLSNVSGHVSSNSTTHTSRFLAQLPQHVRALLDSGAHLTFENHMSGLDDQRLQENAALASFIDVLGHAVDRQGRRYIAMFEAKQYPVYGVQFHPEKNPYEWAPQLAIPHSSDAIAVTHAFAKFLVDEARCNSRGPPRDDALIYNIAPHYTGRVRHEREEADFEQCYFLPPFGNGLL